MGPDWTDIITLILFGWTSSICQLVVLGHGLFYLIINTDNEQWIFSSNTEQFSHLAHRDQRIKSWRRKRPHTRHLRTFHGARSQWGHSAMQVFGEKIRWFNLLCTVHCSSWSLSLFFINISCAFTSCNMYQLAIFSRQKQYFSLLHKFILFLNNIRFFSTYYPSILHSPMSENFAREILTLPKIVG